MKQLSFLIFLALILNKTVQNIDYSLIENEKGVLCFKSIIHFKQAAKQLQAEVNKHHNKIHDELKAAGVKDENKGSAASDKGYSDEEEFLKFEKYLQFDSLRKHRRKLMISLILQNKEKAENFLFDFILDPVDQTLLNPCRGVKILKTYYIFTKSSRKSYTDRSQFDKHCEDIIKNEIDFHPVTSIIRPIGDTFTRRGRCSTNHYTWGIKQCFTVRSKHIVWAVAHYNIFGFKAIAFTAARFQFSAFFSFSYNFAQSKGYTMINRCTKSVLYSGAWTGGWGFWRIQTIAVPGYAYSNGITGSVKGVHTNSWFCGPLSLLPWNTQLIF